MTIDELIAQLHLMKLKYGNVEVGVAKDEEGNDYNGVWGLE